MDDRSLRGLCSQTEESLDQDFAGRSPEVNIGVVPSNTCCVDSATSLSTSVEDGVKVLVAAHGRNPGLGWSKHGVVVQVQAQRVPSLSDFGIKGLSD